MATDPRPSALLPLATVEEHDDELGCNCDHGCRVCGLSAAQMGNCPSFMPCPVGRTKATNCPVHGTEA